LFVLVCGALSAICGGRIARVTGGGFGVRCPVAIR